jgi:hypothetical protein
VDLALIKLQADHPYSRAAILFSVRHSPPPAPLLVLVAAVHARTMSIAISVGLHVGSSSSSAEAACSAGLLRGGGGDDARGPPWCAGLVVAGSGDLYGTMNRAVLF